MKAKDFDKKFDEAQQDVVEDLDVFEGGRLAGPGHTFARRLAPGFPFTVEQRGGIRG